jgi:hypothetical protein
LIFHDDISPSLSKAWWEDVAAMGFQFARTFPDLPSIELMEPGVEEMVVTLRPDAHGRAVQANNTGSLLFTILAISPETLQEFQIGKKGNVNGESRWARNRRR